MRDDHVAVDNDILKFRIAKQRTHFACSASVVVDPGKTCGNRRDVRSFDRSICNGFGYDRVKRSFYGLEIDKQMIGRPALSRTGDPAFAAYYETSCSAGA